MPSSKSVARTEKAGKPTGEQQVAAFLSKLEHPQKAEIEEVRRIILAADSRLTEHIKWNAPSFCLHQEDRLTFQLQGGNGFFRLIFHCGAKARDKSKKGRLIEDTTGLLDWASDDRAIVKFTDMQDVTSKKENLTEAVVKWLEAASS